jgi:glycosyltransferase involved in cell wall biosynthesis
MSAEPLRVLIVTATFDPLIGGAETYASTLAAGLAGRGHDVVVVTDGTHGAAAAREPAEADGRGYSIARLTRYRQALDREGVIPWEVLAFGLLPELAEVIPSPIDIVLTNSLDTAHLGKTIALEHGVPWVATFHEQAPAEAPLGSGVLQLVYETLAPDAVLAGSEMYATRGREWADPAKVALVRHGIDTDLFSPRDAAALRERLGVAQDELLIAFGGRLTPRKGIPDLLSACAELRTRYPNMRVLVAGTVNSSDRSYASALSELAGEQNLEENVIFDERIRRAEMPAVFCAADIVVQPSHAEGLGLAVLEAMSCGRPVVTTDIEATNEIAMDADVLVRCPVGDSASLSSAVAELWEDRPRRIGLGAHAREHVLAHFSEARMIAATDEVFREVVSRSARVAPT